MLAINADFQIDGNIFSVPDYQFVEHEVGAEIFKNNIATKPLYLILGVKFR